MHDLKCISMMKIAEGNIVLLAISGILASFKGIAVSICINLNEKNCDLKDPVRFSEWQWLSLKTYSCSPSLRPCGSGPGLGSSQGQPSLSCELLLGTCCATAQYLISTCIFLTTSCSWQSSCHALDALEITMMSPCQHGCWIWLHSLGLTWGGQRQHQVGLWLVHPDFWQGAN